MSTFKFVVFLPDEIKKDECDRIVLIQFENENDHW
jgi:hypothetical protein